MEEPQDNRLWTKEFIMLTICNLLLFLNLQMIISPLPAYVKETFHADNLTVSLFTTLFALSAIAARLYSAKALEKGKRNLILFLGLFIAFFATYGYLWSGTIAMLLLMRILFGLGFGMGSTALPTMASNIIPIKRMGEGMGYFGLSTALALSLGPVIGSMLLRHCGFHMLVYATLVVIFVIFPLAYPLTRKAKRQQPAMNNGSKQGFNRALILPSVLNLLMSITYGGLLSFINIFGKKVGLPNAALFFLFNAIAVVLIRPISGRIYDRKGHKALLVPAAMFVMIGLILVSYSATTPMLALAALCYGLGFGTIQPTLQSWMIQKVTPEQQGMANSMYFNSLDFGIAVGSMLLGQIASLTSYTMMYRLSSLFLAVFIVVYVIAMMKKSASNRSVNVSDQKVYNQ